MGEIEDEGGALLPGGVYARAWERMTDTLLTERDAASILESLARITGETLGVDRSLIFEVKFAKVAEGEFEVRFVKKEGDYFDFQKAKATILEALQANLKQSPN